MVRWKLAISLVATAGLASPAWAESHQQAIATATPTHDLPAAADPILAAASAASFDVALAGEPETNTAESSWEVMVVPYLWASGMKVDIATPQGEGVDIDQSFGDILSDIKFTFMGALQARNGRFVTINDIIFLSTESTDEGNIGPGLVEAEVDMRVFTTTLLAGYRVVDQGPLFLDLMGGARISSIKAEMELRGPLQTVERESSETKVGPVIASRFRMPLADKWGLELYGDLGGFGVTSDLSWQLLGTIQYEISDHWRLGAGWRHFKAEQNKDGFEIDLAMTGPFLAFGYKF